MKAKVYGDIDMKTTSNICIRSFETLEDLIKVLNQNDFIIISKADKEDEDEFQVKITVF